MRAFIILTVLLCGLLIGGDALWPLKKKKPLSPVVFVPGDGGSQIDARLNKSETPHYICAKQSDWYNLWLNLEQLIVPMAYCFVDNAKLIYDPITRTTHNTPGVDTRVPGWGDPTVVEWIDPTKNKNGAYFKDIANMLQTLGYERGRSLRGAPYDFRKAPNELKQWFIDFKLLIENTYDMNEHTPVTIISHSMGSPMTLVFLQRQTSEWKRKFIARQISLAGAWGGSMKAVKVFAMGDDLDSVFLPGSVLKAEQISTPSTAWLLPSPLFWKSSEVLVQTPTRNYTMAQLEQFFNDLDYRTGWEMRKDSLLYTLNFGPPDVELHCLYGNGVDTVERLVYKKNSIIDQTPTLIMGRGDGTVNERSLRACHVWTAHQEANISFMELNGVNHLGVLAHADALNYIKNVLQP